MDELITAEELAEELQTVASPIVVDVRWSLGAPPSHDEYLAGHIPSAVWADLDRDFADPPGRRGRHPLPDPARLEVSMRRWGIYDDGAVVVYDSADATSAARAWWTLRWAGLARVRVLNGGLAAWTAAGLPLVTGDEPARGGTVRVRPGQMPVVDAAAAAAVAEAGTLLDARAAERYRGDVEPVDKVAGHIPGAVNAPTVNNVDADGRFLSSDALRHRFGGLGVRSDRPVAAYCGSGVTAAHTVLALSLTGTQAALYPGSWSEWITDPTRQVATGRAPGEARIAEAR